MDDMYCLALVGGGALSSYMTLFKVRLKHPKYLF